MRSYLAVLCLEGDVYVADCPQLGTVSQGLTIEEAVRNLKEATEVFLECAPTRESRKVVITTFEVDTAT